MRPPAPRPCDLCPYRRDVPSGIWDAGEYARLPGYDGPTATQRHEVFGCHLGDGRLCSGWVACHRGEELLALRLSVAAGHMTPQEWEQCARHESPVPVFASGREAHDHGVADIDNPGAEAMAGVRKLLRRRGDEDPAPHLS